MKFKILKNSILFLTLLLINYANSQELDLYKPKIIEISKFNKKNNTCLTTEQRASIAQTLKKSSIKLKLGKTSKTKNVKANNPLFAWPVKKADGLNYESAWGIAQYVDHNLAFSNQIEDYNCGTKTYDTSNYNHPGVDIFTWPFPWKLMDNDEAEVIAAAPGTIIAKYNGQYDRNCAFGSGFWNAIFIEPSDGSIAWYAHMKNGSLSSKNVGEDVIEGEFLGIIGSSGDSLGPHLHFEIHDADDNIIDPYSGTCNNFNQESWWQIQKPYNNPNINALLTHSAMPIIPDCPETETTNESNKFDIDQTIYFGLYIRDPEIGSTANLKLIQPNDLTFDTWDYIIEESALQNVLASSFYWNRNDLAIVGEWKWEVIYAGKTVTHSFNIERTLSIDEKKINDLFVYPNPADDMISFSSKNIKTATIINIFGETVKLVAQPEGIEKINISQLPNGLYFLMTKDLYNKKEIIKLVKK